MDANEEAIKQGGGPAERGQRERSFQSAIRFSPWAFPHPEKRGQIKHFWERDPGLKDRGGWLICNCSYYILNEILLLTYMYV